jgi:hypothetical protein
MNMTQMTKHSRMYNEEFHTAVQHMFVAALGLILATSHGKIHLFIHQSVAFTVLTKDSYFSQAHQFLDLVLLYWLSV